MYSSAPRGDPRTPFCTGNTRCMESVADYAGAYGSHLGLLGAFLERIAARVMDIVTEDVREGRGQWISSS